MYDMRYGQISNRWRFDRGVYDITSRLETIIIVKNRRFRSTYDYCSVNF